MDLQKIQAACQKYGFSAKDWKDGMIAILDKKGQFAGHIQANGEIKPKFIGKKNCMGSLIQNDIREALK